MHSTIVSTQTFAPQHADLCVLPGGGADEDRHFDSRGEGDAKATDIYAGAFSKNEDFFRFNRSINAYKNNFSSAEDIILLEPDSEFFRYFSDSRGKQ